jgi:hypothetical protein
MVVWRHSSGLSTWRRWRPWIPSSGIRFAEIILKIIQCLIRNFARRFYFARFPKLCIFSEWPRLRSCNALLITISGGEKLFTNLLRSFWWSDVSVDDIKDWKGETSFARCCSSKERSIRFSEQGTNIPKWPRYMNPWDLLSVSSGYENRSFLQEYRDRIYQSG